MPIAARLLLWSVLFGLLAACSSQRPDPAITYTARSSSVQPSDVLFRAIGLVGTPYRWGGNTPESGFDCSGLIGYVYRGAAGVSLPRTTTQMSQRGVEVGRSALQVGDLLFFATSGGRRVSHAGIYVGGGRFVHAPSSGGTVRLDRLDNSYWQKTYLTAKRVLDEGRLASNP